MTAARRLTANLVAVSLAVTSAFAAPAAPSLKTKLAEKARQYAWMSTDPTIVAAVKARNASPPAELQGMTQDKWKALPVLDPLVRSLNKNSLAEYLKGKRDPAISEFFVNAADGTKIVLFNKTTNWSHKGKDKHEIPMTGKVYFGPVEIDASSGVEQVQIGLPVLDGTKPIGSIVIGLETSKLK